MYHNDEYGQGNYGSFYHNQRDDRNDRWNDDNDYGNDSNQQHRSNYGSVQNRYRNPQQHNQQQHYGQQYQNRGGQYNQRPQQHDMDYRSQGGYQGGYRGQSSNSGRQPEPWNRYNHNDGYAHGRPFVPEDRDWLDRTGDEFRSWFGDEEAEARRRMDRYDNDPHPRDYYGRRFRVERLREESEHRRAAAPIGGPPYGPNTGAEY